MNKIGVHFEGLHRVGAFVYAYDRGDLYEEVAVGSGAGVALKFRARPVLGGGLPCRAAPLYAIIHFGVRAGCRGGGMSLQGHGKRVSATATKHPTNQQARHPLPVVRLVADVQ
jgi:hypothetical protein